MRNHHNGVVPIHVWEYGHEENTIPCHDPLRLGNVF